MPPTNRTRRGYATTPTRVGDRIAFTWIEVTIVVVLLSIITAVSVPCFIGATSEPLYAAAHVVAADLQYCRELAVSNNSDYEVGFDVSLNRYEISHQGANASLDALPPTSFLVTKVGDGGKMIQYNALEQKTNASPLVKIHDVTRNGVSSPPLVRFTRSGCLAGGAVTQIWLTTGHGSQQEFVSIDIDPSTGDVRIGNVTEAHP